MRPWMPSAVGSVHTQMWVPLSTRRISDPAMAPRARSECSGPTSLSALPWTSRVGDPTEPRGRSRSGKRCWSFFKPARRPERVALRPRTKPRVSSWAQMCSVSSLASVPVRCPSSLTVEAMRDFDACSAMACSTKPPSPLDMRLRSMLATPVANAYEPLTAAQATSARTRSGCAAASW